MRIPLEMGEAEPQQLVIVPQILIVALKEVATRMKGHTTWSTILRICPTMKTADVTTYETTLIVASMVKTCGIGLMSVVLGAHLIQRMNPFTFVKGLQKSKTIPSTNRLRICRSK